MPRLVAGLGGGLARGSGWWWALLLLPCALIGLSSCRRAAAALVLAVIALAPTVARAQGGPPPAPVRLDAPDLDPGSSVATRKQSEAVIQELADRRPDVMGGSADLAPATKTLLKTKVGITKLRGTWQSFAGLPVMPTFHLAYLLRAYTRENRQKVFDDLRAARARLDEAS